MDNTNQSPSSPSPQPPPALRSSSASSLSSQLFGDNDSQHSSAGILASIFPPPSTAAGNGSCQRCSQPIQYEAFDRQVWSTIHGAPPVLLSEDANNGVMKSIFIEKMEPCPLGSSIYYGGQEDMYIPSSASKSYTKDPKDDLQAATRGNWWQGSLYY